MTAVQPSCWCPIFFQANQTLSFVSRPVFNHEMDTYDSLHERSPFAVDAICMVAARVRDAGGNISTSHLVIDLTFIFYSGKPSEVHLKLLEEVQNIARATLFAPVVRAEAVQAMSKLSFLSFFSKSKLTVFTSPGLRLVR